MSDTTHHRKPGQPRTPRKGAHKGRTTATLHTRMWAGDDSLTTWEPSSTRRTR